MDPQNPLFAISVFGVAFITGSIIKRLSAPEISVGRHQTIDGMRGFLALSVFIHHSCIWYQFIQTGGQWDFPKSNLYTQLGKTGVTLFFMITSFLFVTKLLNARETGFDWKYFFRSRIVRIAPMYYFSVILIFLITMILSNWKLNVSLFDFINSIYSWVIFTINGDYKINNCDVTGIINAGVVWSLAYEWLFYFCLPLLALFLLKIIPRKIYFIISIVFIILFWNVHEINKHIVYSFIGGAIAPFLLKYTSLNNKADHVLSSIIVLTCLLSLGAFDSSDNDTYKIFITIIFTYIAMGNSLFGLLKNSTLKFLGDISYSTYLLHGIILFVILYLGLGTEKVKLYSPTEYCVVILLTTPLVVVISFAGYRLIEKPFMNKYNRKKEEKKPPKNRLSHIKTRKHYL